MGCLLIALALLLPRVAIVLLFLFTRLFDGVFTTWLWPLLGFIFLPYTLLAYTAAVVNTGGAITPGWLVLIVIAIVVDVGHWERGYRFRRR